MKGKAVEIEIDAENPRDFFSPYMQFVSNSEAPDFIHFWCAVGAISGALGRRCWLDLGNFDFTPNMYIVLVAPPGVVAKSTTISTAVSLLKEVQGIHFGPDIATPQALLDYFADSADFFELDGAIHRHSSLFVESSEFGNLFRNKDDVLSNLLIALWDGKRGSFQKSTRMHGKTTIENPLLTILAATTPSWISHHISEQMLSGGFVSRCLFPYAARKQRLIAYPQGKSEEVALVRAAFRKKLISILQSVRAMQGPFRLSPEAHEYGEHWYSHHFSYIPLTYDSVRFSGYRERKQVHAHKIAMCLSAGESSSRIIERRHLELAMTMLEALEKDFDKVFTSVGQSGVSRNVDKLIQYVHLRGHAKLSEAHAAVHKYFPSSTTFGDVLRGCLEAGYLLKHGHGKDCYLSAGPIRPQSLIESELEVTRSVLELDLPLKGMR